jgi:hypothetical protein
MRSDGMRRFACRVTYLRHGSGNDWIGAAVMRPGRDGMSEPGVVDVSASGRPGRESSVAVMMVLDVPLGSTEDRLLRIAFSTADPVFLRRCPGASVERESEWNREWMGQGDDDLGTPPPPVGDGLLDDGRPS